MSKRLLFFGIFLSLIIRGFFIINGTNVADIKLLHGMGEAFLKGLNPYLSLTYNSYPPIAVYIEAATILLSNLTHIPFHQLTRIWPNIADIFITIILYKSLIRLNFKPLSASLWALIYILNPISILISSTHGQLDSVVSFFVLLSIYLITLSKKSHLHWSAISLGIAIAIKPNPLMLVPFFLIFIKSNLRKKIIFLLLTLSPVTLTLIPYLQNIEVWGKIFSYGGVFDFSYAAILRGVWYQQNAQLWPPYTTELLLASKIAFLVGLTFLITLFYKSINLAKVCLVVYLLFLTIYFGISAQYLIWILPLAILAKEKRVLLFTISGTFALLGFYTFFGGDILFGKFWNGKSLQSSLILPYFTGNLLLWVTLIYWLVKIVRFEMKSISYKLTSLHKKVLYVSLLLLLISTIPILRWSLLILQQSFQ